MGAAPVITILEMLWTILSSIINTTGKLGSLFLELIGQLGMVSSIGPSGWLLSGVVILIVVFFLAKFVIGAGKNLMMAIFLGLLLLIILAVLV